MLDLEASNPNYKLVNVTVYLAPGDYYLFNCFGKFVEDQACELKTPAIDWCGDLGLTLPQEYTRYDNVHYHFVNMCKRSAEIANPSSYSVLGDKETMSNFNQATYDALCASSTKNPVFNIMDPYFNFNITGKMTFEGIEFNGIQAASSYTDFHFPPTNRIPVKLCQVEKEPFTFLKEQVNDNNNKEQAVAFTKTDAAKTSKAWNKSHVYYGSVTCTPDSSV